MTIAPKMMPLRLPVLLLTSLMFGAGLSAAQGTGFTLDSTLERLAQFELQVEPGQARPGEHVRLVTTARIRKGWHIYSLQPQGEFGPEPTHLTTQAPGLDLIGPGYETNPTHQLDTAFGLDLWFHPVAARFYQNLIVRKAEATGSVPVQQSVRYQVCNDRFCTPPRTDILTTSLAIGPGAVRPEYATMLRTVDYVDSSGRFEVNADSLDAVLARGLPAFLLLAAGFGLLALLTPCVFPMVPVTVSFFTGQMREVRSGLGSAGSGNGATGSGGLGNRGIGLAIVFGLGLIVSYTGLGLGMTLLLGASGAGRFATSPWVNLLVAGFFTVFALALLGWIAPALPSGLVQRLDRSAQRLHGPVGVLLMGVAFTAANFTCTMPFVGTLLLAASQGHVLWPLVGMLVFSTVFALPFVALAIFPRWLVKLRGRSGPWLTQIKVTLGLVEIGAALKFLSNADVVWGWGVINREVLLGLWALISVVCGLTLVGWIPVLLPDEPRSLPARLWNWMRRRLGRRDASDTMGRVVFAVPGAAFLVLAAYLTWGLLGQELDASIEAYLPPPVGRSADLLAAGIGDETVARLPWNRSLDKALTAANATGKPIFIDFTGYTCVNCRWMEKKIFAKRPVLNMLRDRFVLLQLYTDGGPDGERNQRLQVERFRTLALPYYVILAPDNSVLATHAGILPSVPGFLDFLAQGARATCCSSGKPVTTPQPPAAAPRKS